MGPDLTLLKKSLEESDLSALFLERQIDAMLVELVDYLNPVRQNIDRRPGSGAGYQAYKRTPGLTPNQSALNIDVDDVDDAEESTGTYTDLFLPYKTILTRGKISRRVQKTGKTVAELLREEMEAKAKEVRDAEEFRIYWGNHPTANSKQWPGLNSYFVANTGQVVGLTNTGTGVAPTLEKLDELLDVNIGNPGLILTSRTGRRKINALLQTTQRFVDRIEIRGGFRVMSYNDVPILASTAIPDTIDITSGGTVSALTGGSTTVIITVDQADVFMSVLTELMTMPLARRSSQFEEFDIFLDETLVVRDVRHISQMTGVKAKG
jgi:hypothetical protein